MQWLLGFVEDAEPTMLLRHRFPSKVGGRPVGFCCARFLHINSLMDLGDHSSEIYEIANLYFASWIPTTCAVVDS